MGHTALGVATLMLFTSGNAAAATMREHVLYPFTGGVDGGSPQARLAFDSAGNMFGTTHFGGIATCGGTVGGGCGVVFELSRSGKHHWHENPLYAFADGADGGFPNAGVIVDRSGNLYGTASTGGNSVCSIGCGVVYELRKQRSVWSETVLHAFSGGDGQFPNAVLFPGVGGALYSTSWYGGSHGAGTVFELVPQGSSWTETVLYSFKGTQDGSNPAGSVVQDTGGNLYGTTYSYNGYNDGVAFALHQGRRLPWKERIVMSFTSGPGGENPYAGLTMDSDGNLYGTTIEGGTSGNGVVFEFVHRSAHHAKENILHTFSGTPDGSAPYAGLTMDGAGNLYGATLFGGKLGYGTIFELVRKGPHRYKERILHSFKGSNDGANPKAEPILGPDGNLYGTTEGGGKFGNGVVYEIGPRA